MTDRERAAFLQPAPAPLHEVVDNVWPLVRHANAMGMAAQIVLSFDRDGRYTGKKVTLSGETKTI